jgi:hypothetical protein
MNEGLSPTSQIAHREAFWALAVGVPGVLSVLRLWVEAGGELQTTLLLVSHVGPLNLVAALFATATQVVTAVLIAIFTAGGILRAAVANAGDDSPLRKRTPLIVRFTDTLPTWALVAALLLALATWRIMYLPLLLPACVAITQAPLWTWNHRWQVAVVGCLSAFAGYLWLVGPAVSSAWSAGEHQVWALLVLPPLVALGVSGPTLEWCARIFAEVVSVAILVMVGLVGWAIVDAPILPLVAIELQADAQPRFVRGHVISVDDKHVVFLLDRGGVRYLDSDNVQQIVLCASPEELPAFTTGVRGYYVEDSLLSALGRQKRPRVDVDPLCGITAIGTPPAGS